MFKRIINSVFICLSLYSLSLADSQSLQSDRYFQNNGGLVDHISPLLIPNTKASALQNITMDDRGQLSKRTGYTELGHPNNAPMTGGGYHNAASGTSFFAVIVGTGVYRTSNSFGGTYTDVTTTVTITSNSTNLAQHTALNDVMVFCNEQDIPFKVSASTNAVQISTTSANPVPNVIHTCTTYGNYVIGGNVTIGSTAFPSRVVWSDVNNPDVWPALNFIDVEPNDGDKIVDVITFKDSVYVFKKRSIYRMVITGNPGADAFLIRPFSRNIGCWAKNSVRVIPNVGIAFLAQNAAYILNDNELSSYNSSQLEAIGDPIQKTFDTVSRSMWSNVVAAVYPHQYQYWLAVSTDGVSNKEVLIYDYIQKSWSVYTGMEVNMLEQAENVVGQNILVSGDNSGYHYLQDNGTSDNPANVSTAISASYTTADLTLQSPEYTKNFKYLYIISQVDTSTTLTVQAAFDYNSTFEYNNSISLGTPGAIYDTSIYDTDIYPAIGLKTTRIEINRSARAMKLNFTNSTASSILGVVGWVIVYSNEDYKQ